MSDPKRWLDTGGGATASERELLRIGRRAEPPEGASQAVLAGVLAKVAPFASGAPPAASGAAAPTATPLPAAGAGGAATSTIATGAATSTIATGLGAGIAKAVLAGVVGGVIAISGYDAIRRPSTNVPPPPVSVAVAPVIPAPSMSPLAPPAVEPVREPEAVVPPEAATAERPADAAPEPIQAPKPVQRPSPAPLRAEAQDPSNVSPRENASPATPAERASRLREESAGLAEARGALQGGNAGKALELLDRSRTRFPSAMLGQEREALTIEALAKSGRHAEASQRAAAFMSAYPQSPYVTRLQTFVR